MTNFHKAASDNAQKDNQREYIVSIETAVRGGSIAILKDDKIIAAATGKSEISKSEDILEELKNILLKNKIKKTEIKLVVFSRGPGSYTGIRIGAALAQGLSKALNCDYLGLPILEVVMSEGAENEKNEKVVTAVEFGKNQVCWQFFNMVLEGKIQDLTAPQISKLTSFLEDIESEKFDSLILPEHLYNDLSLLNQKRIICNRQVIKTSDNLAVLMGTKAAKLKNSYLVNQKDIHRPIYVKDFQK